MIDTKEKFDSYLTDYLEDVIIDSIKGDYGLTLDKIAEDLIYSVLTSPDIDKKSLTNFLDSELRLYYDNADSYDDLINLAISEYIEIFINQNSKLVMTKILKSCLSDLLEETISDAVSSVFRSNFDTLTWWDESKMEILNSLELSL